MSFLEKLATVLSIDEEKSGRRQARLTRAANSAAPRQPIRTIHLTPGASPPPRTERRQSATSTPGGPPPRRMTPEQVRRSKLVDSSPCGARTAEGGRCGHLTTGGPCAAGHHPRR